VVAHGIEDLDRAALGRRQLAAAGDALAGVAGGILAQHLMRIVDAQPGPGALLLRALAERLGLTLPHAVLVKLIL
jgi:hypothetical protein